MAIYKELRIEGAFTFKDPVVIPLDKQGLVFIKGINHDAKGQKSSNGAGKSSIFEILYNIHFDTTVREVKKSSVAPKGQYLGEVDLYKDDENKKLFTIRQSRDHDIHGTSWSILIDGLRDGHQPRGDLRKIGPYIQSMLDLSQEQFLGCVYLSEVHTLIQGKPNERNQFLSSIRSLDRYDRVRESLKVKRKELEEKINELDVLVPLLDSLLKRLAEFPKKIEIDIKMKWLKQSSSIGVRLIRDLRSRLDELVEWIRTERDRDKILRQLQEYGRSQSDLVSMETEKEQLDHDLQRKEAEYRANERTLERIVERKQVEADLAKIPAYVKDLQATELDSQKDFISDKISKAKTASRKVDKLNSLVKELVGKDSKSIEQEKSELALTTSEAWELYSDFKAREANALGNIKELTDLKALVQSGNCPTCKRPITVAEIDTVLEKLNKEASEACENKVIADKNYRLNKAKCDNLELLAKKLGEIAQLREDCGEWEGKASEDIKKEIIDLEEQKRKLNADSEFIIKLESLKVSLERLGIVSGSEKEVQKSMATMSSELNDLRETIKWIGEVVIVIKQAVALPKQRDANALLKEKEFSMYEIDRLEELLRGVEREIGELDHIASQVEDLDEELDELHEKLSLLPTYKKRNLVFNTLDKAYSPKGLKLNRLREAGGMFEKQINVYTSRVFSEPMRFQFEIDDANASLMADRPGYDPYDVRGLSSGQKGRLSVGLISAVDLIVPQRKKSNILILDEVDKHLDPAGVELLAGLLKELKTRYSTIFLVSHGNEAAYDESIDRVWTVEMRSGVSTLSFT